MIELAAHFHRYRVSLISAAIIVLFAAAGIASLGWWLTADPYDQLAVRLPGADGRPETPAVSASVVIGELYQRFDGGDGSTAAGPFALGGEAGADGAPSAEASWPRFRGTTFDNIGSTGVPLSADWTADPPERLWAVNLGEGHAGSAVANGRVYLLDYDEAAGADMLRCFSLEDGSELWRRGYTVDVKRNHGRSRSVPAVDGRFVVSLGPKGHVMCVDAATGEYLWGIDLVQQYGSLIPPWYTAQCPLIDEGVAVLAPAGASLMIGVLCETGRVVWETPNPEGWSMSHSSIMPMTLDGKGMYVYAAAGGLAGVSAEEEDRGMLLWATSLWSPEVVAPSPVVLDNGKIFVTAGYGAGSMMVEVSREGDSYAVRELYSFAPGEGLSCEQQTPISYRGRLYGIAPKDAGSLRNQFLCADPESAEVLWSSGKTERFGLGPFMVADGKFLLLSDDGTLSLVDASSDSYRLLTRAKVLEGRDAWAPMALAGGRLLLRDSRQLICLDVGG